MRWTCFCISSQGGNQSIACCAKGQADDVAPAASFFAVLKAGRSRAEEDLASTSIPSHIPYISHIPRFFFFFRF